MLPIYTHTRASKQKHKLDCFRRRRLSFSFLVDSSVVRRVSIDLLLQSVQIQSMVRGIVVVNSVYFVFFFAPPDVLSFLAKNDRQQKRQCFDFFCAFALTKNPFFQCTMKMAVFKIIRINYLVMIYLISKNYYFLENFL